MRNPFLAMTPRRFAITLALAIGTAATIGTAMVEPALRVLRARVDAPAPSATPDGGLADAPRCAAGQTANCVGGTAGVILLAPVRSVVPVVPPVPPAPSP